MRVRARAGRFSRLGRHIRIALESPYIRGPNATRRSPARVLVISYRRIQFCLDSIAFCRDNLLCRPDRVPVAATKPHRTSIARFSDRWSYRCPLVLDASVVQGLMVLRQLRRRCDWHSSVAMAEVRSEILGATKDHVKTHE